MSENLTPEQMAERIKNLEKQVGLNTEGTASKKDLGAIDVKVEKNIFIDKLKRI